MTRRLSPPSILHAAVCAFDTVAEVTAAFIREYLGRAPFNYALLDEVARVSMLRRFDIEQLNSLVRSRQKVISFQKNFLEITPLIHKEFGLHCPKFVIERPEQFRYPVNEMQLPFRPRFAFEQQGRIVIPAIIYWRTNKLTSKQTSLFATLATELLQQHPDYADADLRIYDFSVPPGCERRASRITAGASVPLMSDQERDDTLGILVEGFIKAKLLAAELATEVRRATSVSSQLALPGIDP